MAHVIYGLYDPRIDPILIRYVGYTGKDVPRRIREHLAEAKQKCVNHRHKWLLKLIKDGIKPSYVILEQIGVTEKSWKRRETYWIAKFPKKQLCNSTAGGEGLINPSQDVRDRIAEGNKGQGRPNPNKGIKLSEAHVQAIKDGLAKSEKAAAAWAAKKGVDPCSNLSEVELLARYDKISAAMTGKKRKPFSESCRTKMSESHKGLIHPEATKQKMRETRKGKKHTPESLAAQKIGIANSEKFKAASIAKIGSRYINNGLVIKQLKAHQRLPKGWVFGMLKRS